LARLEPTHLLPKLVHLQRGEDSAELDDGPATRNRYARHAPHHEDPLSRGFLNGTSSTLFKERVNPVEF
jgi:hypothetical protein